MDVDVCYNDVEFYIWAGAYGKVELMPTKHIITVTKSAALYEIAKSGYAFT
jgi:hypothetical protein